MNLQYLVHLSLLRGKEER